MFANLFKKPQGMGMFGGQPETYDAMGGYGQMPGAAQGGGFQMRNPMLAMAGLGMLSGRNNREAMSGAAKGAMMGMQYGQQQSNEQAEIEALSELGLPEGQLKLAQKSPTYRAKLLEAHASPKEAKNIYTGTDAGVLNQQTGELRPFAAGGQPTAKAPAGFEWIKNPEGQWEQAPVPGGPATQIPAEQAARLAMADSFLGQAPALAENVKAGDVTGPWDHAKARMGVGNQGRIYAKIESGVDALRRGLTGAGMPAEEADDYARRYLPTSRDNAETAADKMAQLERELNSIRARAEQGRVPRRPTTQGPNTTATGVQWSVEN
jgi:hypothetical protein